MNGTSANEQLEKISEPNVRLTKSEADNQGKEKKKKKTQKRNFDEKGQKLQTMQKLKNTTRENSQQLNPINSENCLIPGKM